MDGPGVEIGGEIDEWLRSAAEGLEYVDVVDGKGIGGRHPAPLRRLVLQRLHPDVASGLPNHPCPSSSACWLSWLTFAGTAVKEGQGICVRRARVNHATRFRLYTGQSGGENELPGLVPRCRWARWACVMERWCRRGVSRMMIFATPQCLTDKRIRQKTPAVLLWL